MICGILLHDLCPALLLRAPARHLDSTVTNATSLQMMPADHLQTAVPHDETAVVPWRPTRPTDHSYPKGRASLLKSP